jgi:hypothetical protein
MTGVELPVVKDSVEALSRIETCETVGHVGNNIAN